MNLLIHDTVQSKVQTPNNLACSTGLMSSTLPWYCVPYRSCDTPQFSALVWLNFVHSPRKSYLTLIELSVEALLSRSTSGFQVWKLPRPLPAWMEPQELWCILSLLSHTHTILGVQVQPSSSSIVFGNEMPPFLFRIQVPYACTPGVHGFWEWNGSWNSVIV